MKLDSRCAGNIFEYESKTLIPIQKDEPIYGSGINLFEIQFLQDSIDFKFYCELDLKPNNFNINGFHTINNFQNLFLVDYRFNKYYFSSIFYKIIILIRSKKRKIIYSNILRYLILFCFFKIKRWHLNSLIAYPRYYQVVKEINQSYNFSSVNEIGCGLSELNRYVKFKNYIGFDIDQNLIKLNYYLKGAKIFDIKNLKHNAECTIMINFLHNLKISDVLELYNKIKNSKYILIDEILEHSVGYKYKHRFNEIFLIMLWNKIFAF